MPTTAPASSPSRFWSPRYWPTWLGLAIMWCLAHLPYRMQMRLGRLLGRALNAIGGRRRHLDAVGIAFIETALSWFTPTERLRPRVEIRGLEHLHAALAQGRGAIVLMGHFTTMELIARLLALRAPLHVTYREHKNRLYQHTLERVHRAHCSAIIAHTDLRAMYRALKANDVLWYAPDQNYRGKLSAFAPFFGVPASTITATSRIAATSGAPVIPVLAERLAGDQGYRVTLQAPLADYPSGDLVADATRINQTIEAQARRIPEQYLWVHRRFKTRPEGEKNVYDA